MKFKSFLYLFFVLLFVQCDDKDAYYERPTWLEESIYDVLKNEGRFNTYLQCVDQTEYALVLKGAGLSTVFAPNDSAFQAYMTEKAYASIQDIPKDSLNNLVAYSIVYSKWMSHHLADYFLDKEYLLGAFKRKTNCYALPYRDPEYDNKWVFNETLKGAYSMHVSNYQYRLAQNNYKYLPVFTNEYFSSLPEALTAFDYNTFFPDATYTGRNVQGGTIVKADILAENGVIHEVSTVNEPMMNMDELLQKNPSYEGFKALLELKNLDGQGVFKKYSEVSENYIDMFQKLSPNKNIDNVYLKYYSGLAFSPLMDNVYSEVNNTYDPEKSGYTLFVPSNTALESYIQTKLLKYYADKEQLPEEIYSTLINTHMVGEMVWPSQFKNSFNSTGEYINGQGTTGSDFGSFGVLGQEIASNGFVYLIDHVIKSKYFETVYSEIFLNPTRAWVNQAFVNFYNGGFRDELMRSELGGYPSERFTILNISDELLVEDGYALITTESPPRFTNELVSGSNTDERLKRLIRSHIFSGYKNNEVNSEITDLTTAPINNYNGWGFLVNSYGDVVRYKNNQLQAAGNIEDDTYVTVTPSVETYNNGHVFNIDKLLQYSPRETKDGDDTWKDLTLWQYLSRAKEQNSGVSMFVDYVQECLKNPDNDDLDGIKKENFYTVLMVNNTAMNQAINNGFLPTLTEIQSDLEAKAQATMFLNAHFLQGEVLVDDGIADYINPVKPLSPNRTLVPTLHKITDEKLDLTNASTRIEVVKDNGLLIFTPQDITLGNRILVHAGFGLTANMRVQRGSVPRTTIPNNFRSNRIACKAILHEVNNFFTFTLNHPAEDEN